MPIQRWPTVYCPDDRKRETSSRVTAFRRFEATLPQAPMRPTTLLHNWSASITLPPHSLHATGTPVLDDDKIPDLLDPDESGDESLPSSLNSNTVFQENRESSVQPSVAVPDTSQHTFDVPTGRHFFNEVLPSVNPLSSNVFESQINSTRLPSPSQLIQPTSMQPTSPAHWSPTHVDLTQTPERVLRDYLQRGLAINSPNLTARLFAHNPILALLPPFDEVRVRQWLREIYPYEFRAYYFWEVDQGSSLELEEVRALLLALIDGHIRVEWFNGLLFTPALGESLALLLRNQRDRFMLDMYDSLGHDHPTSQATHRLIWRTVIQHIARNNQREDYNAWRVAFYEENLLEQRSAQPPNEIDNVILAVLSGYHDRAFHPVPSSAIYATHCAYTYDTLRRDYPHRQHPMSRYHDHQPFATTHENRADMAVRQALVNPPRRRQGTDGLNYLRFRLCPHMQPSQTAELQRTIGPIYNLVTLYAEHSGTYARFQTNGNVRYAISNLLHRHQARHGYPGIVDTSSNDNFTPREFCCLLQALLDGTLQPAQYFGRMLPYQLVSDLRQHVDTATQTRFNHVVQRMEPDVVDLRMYWMVIESDTILDITTEAWVNLFDYATSLRATLRDPQFLDPVNVLRNALRDNAPHWATRANALVGNIVHNLRSTRIRFRSSGTTR